MIHSCVLDVVECVIEHVYYTACAPHGIIVFTAAPSVGVVVRDIISC